MDPDYLEMKRRYRQQILDAMRDWPRRPADVYGPLLARERMLEPSSNASR